MQYRRLGRTGLKISEIGFGAWGIGGLQWIGAEDSVSLRALHRAADLGLNFIDTALAYGEGHSERVIRRFLEERGAGMIVATKIPPKDLEWPALHDSLLEDVFPAEHIVSSTELSLRNLGLDCLDLQQFHVWNDRWASRDEW